MYRKASPFMITPTSIKGENMRGRVVRNNSCCSRITLDLSKAPLREVLILATIIGRSHRPGFHRMDICYSLTKVSYISANEGGKCFKMGPKISLNFLGMKSRLYLSFLLNTTLLVDLHLYFYFKNIRIFLKFLMDVSCILNYR